MALSLSGRQIFLASPGGLKAERERLRATADRYNRTAGLRRGVAFITRGWEEVPGGLGRPQSLINEIVDECDYTVVILADRWGSSPGEDNYSSGTEEEFMRSLELRADPQGHMRDVLVLFRSVPDSQLADPGKELSKVLSFKKRLEESKQILYDTFDSLDALQERFEKALAKWDEPWEQRVLLAVTLPAEMEGTILEPPQDPLERALELAASGQLVQAEVLFAKAVQDDSPHALSQFARFLRRQGRLNDSRVLNMRVVEELAGQAALSPENAGFLSDSLANVGVIARKQGKLADSARALAEAIKIATYAAAPMPQQLAYALDNLGHTQSQLGMQEEAASSFSEAERVRSQNGGIEEVTSLLNRGWNGVRTRDYEAAISHFEKAETIARAHSDEESLARALAGKGSGLQKSGRPELAIEPLAIALEINTRLNVSDGIGITAGLLARAYLMTGDTDAAARAANEVLESSQTSTNVTGLATAKWIQAQVERSRSNSAESSSLYEEAITLAQRSGNARLAAAVEADYTSGTST